MGLGSWIKKAKDKAGEGVKGAAKVASAEVVGKVPGGKTALDVYQKRKAAKAGDAPAKEVPVNIEGITSVREAAAGLSALGIRSLSHGNVDELGARAHPSMAGRKNTAYYAVAILEEGLIAEGLLSAPPTGIFNRSVEQAVGRWNEQFIRPEGTDPGVFVVEDGIKPEWKPAPPKSPGPERDDTDGAAQVRVGDKPVELSVQPGTGAHDAINGIPFFDQGNEIWADTDMRPDMRRPFGKFGCTVCALTSLVAHVTGDKHLIPPTLSTWLYSNGGYGKEGVAVVWGAVANYLRSYTGKPFRHEQKPWDVRLYKDLIARKIPPVVRVPYGGGRIHFVLGVGVLEEDMLFHDPGTFRGSAYAGPDARNTLTSAGRDNKDYTPDRLDWFELV